MTSGDKCDTGGTYFAFGCGHADVETYQEFEEFPNCRTCGKPIKWICRMPDKD
jgi:hypothetical protein